MKPDSKDPDNRNRWLSVNELTESEIDTVVCYGGVETKQINSSRQNKVSGLNLRNLLPVFELSNYFLSLIKLYPNNLWIKSGLLLLIFCFSTGILCSKNKESIGSTSIHGRILNKNTGKGIEYVTIAVYSTLNNELITGTITNVEGEFTVTGLSPGVYYMDLSFIGYDAYRVDEIQITSNRTKVDLGVIYLNKLNKAIQEIEVSVEKPNVEFKLDKKVVNVSNQFIFASGSAVDVLRNVPSVTVDVEGGVLLRGSADFKVLINGIPSVLESSDALEQIPASSIENIEIITNPSAQYNPEGTAGIINIITKKGKFEGGNGIFNLNAGTNAVGGDVLVNFKSNKLRYFVAADYNYRDYSGKRNGFRYSTVSDIDYNIEYQGNIATRFDRMNIRGGLDYTFDSLNIINLDMNYGNRNRFHISDLNYSKNNNYEPDEFHYRDYEKGYRGGDRYSANMVFLHSFIPHHHDLKATLVFRYGDGNEYSRSLLFDANNIKTEGKENVEKGPSRTWQSNIDYSLNKGKGVFEAGYQGLFTRSEDETAFLTDDNGDGFYMNNTLYNNLTTYIQDIYSVYAIYGNECNKINFQIGLRGEFVNRQIDFENSVSAIPNGETKFKQERFDIFPSVHASYHLPLEQEIVVSYSRRIDRLRSYYLEPFYTWMDAYNIRMGNPDLMPEYIDSYELKYLKKFSEALISLESYYRVTHDKVEWVRRVYDKNTIQRSPENVGNDYYMGMDATFSYNMVKWWRVDLTGSLYNYKVTGSTDSLDFNAENITWNYLFNNTYKINKSTQVQAYWRYYSKRVTSQGYYEPVYTLDLALRKEFFDRKLTGVVQVRDVFSTNNRETKNFGLDFIDYYYQKYDTPIVTFTFTYKFNNYKPSKRSGSSSRGSIFGDEGEIE